MFSLSLLPVDACGPAPPGPPAHDYFVSTPVGRKYAVVTVRRAVHGSSTFLPSGMAIFTVAKGGLMYEISVGGQKFDFMPAGRR